MLVNNLVKLYKTANPNTVKTLTWVLSKIDYSKLMARVKYAYENPSEPVKCVLLEYAYTTRAHANKGHENIVDYMPNSTVLVHHALHTPDFIRTMDEFFGANNDTVSIYVRQKIGPDGEPNFHRKQLVVLFEPYSVAKMGLIETGNVDEFEDDVE